MDGYANDDDVTSIFPYVWMQHWKMAGVMIIDLLDDHLVKKTARLALCKFETSKLAEMAERNTTLQKPSPVAPSDTQAGFSKYPFMDSQHYIKWSVGQLLHWLCLFVSAPVLHVCSYGLQL